MRHILYGGLICLLLLGATPAAAEPGQPAPGVFLPWIAATPQRLLIAAAHIDSARSGEADEAILIWNIGDRPVALAGWQIASGARSARVPASAMLELAAGQRLWCAAEAAAFAQSFGELPACEWAADSDPGAPNLEGDINLVNSGGILRLLDAQGAAADVLVYADETTPAEGWQGAPAQLYTHGVVSAQGQVWQRKRDPASGLPLDSDRASDWAGDLADVAWGRQVRWPGWLGWDNSQGAQPATGEAFANLLVAVGPEGLYQQVAQALESAQASIDLSLYTFEHPQLAQVLAAAAGRGVRVRILLDGSPPGGVTDLQRWCVAQIAAGGGDVRYLAVAADAPAGSRRRYRYLHAKYGVIDGRLALVSTDNFSQDSMPLPSSRAVGGRRGFALRTDAPPAVAALQALFDADWRPGQFLDLVPYSSGDAKYGAAPAGYAPPAPAVYAVGASPFAAPAATTGLLRVAVVAAPENAGRPDAGLLALIARAGVGDELDLMQLYEHRHWGPTTSNPLADPNPRLEALIDAARRGARVRILLDSFFDEPAGLRSNAATVAYVQAVAAAEGLDLAARLGNPTRGGIHAKLLLARVGGEHWAAVGSLNGGEVSHKLNREVVLLVEQAAIYHYLRQVFDHDWLYEENRVESDN
jgi:phosphatidylserine/phosphatidylglycerophosphate/cardiolipin synthase-like enzyme